MTEQEKRERAEFDAKLLALIAKGEITPEEANDEWYYHYNGMDSRQNTCGL